MTLVDWLLGAAAISFLLTVPLVRRRTRHAGNRRLAMWILWLQVSLSIAVLALILVQQLSGPIVVTLDLVAIAAVLVS